MIKHISDVDSFHEIIKEGKYLVDFYATWCGPCKMLEPVLEEISNDIDVLKVDTDLVSDLAVEYGVMSIPMLFYLDNGKIVNKSIGYVTKDEIYNMIK